MHPIRRLAPELDRVGNDSQDAPVRRARGGSLERVHQVRVAGAQWLEVVDRLAWRETIV